MGLRKYHPFNPGTIYLRSGDDNHFWIVLSDPAQDKDQVLTVNLTTHEAYKEQTCILEAGEHACISRRCCIYYTGARIEQLSKLQYAELCHKIEIKGKVDDAILQRIRQGAESSDNMMKAGCALLRKQGFLPEEQSTSAQAAPTDGDTEKTTSPALSPSRPEPPSASIPGS